MSSFCASCGVIVPEGQRFCSMCYGDPAYGTDGIYAKWLADQAEEEAFKKWEMDREMTGGVSDE